MGAIGRQEFRGRFMLGVTSLADAEFLQLNTAALQSHSTASTTGKLNGREGRTFVEPTGDSLKAAMRFAEPDAATNTWLMQYDKLVSAEGRNAYPGTLPVFATVRTSNLTADDGRQLSQLLKFAVGDGQVQGLGSGKLPPGYLPLTAANGLGDFVAYTLRAADAVAAQTGSVPLLIPAANPTTQAPASGGGTGGTATAGVPAAGSRPSGAVPSASASQPPAGAQRPAGFD